ncbi:hypothetical protein VARIO8X_100221 [Burkholderiales bacterium 8X]|nr:hypothetical protein VARIO8X_100221 [Burkholderiales bacterium 8X]
MHPQPARHQGLRRSRRDRLAAGGHQCRAGRAGADGRQGFRHAGLAASRVGSHAEGQREPDPGPGAAIARRQHTGPPGHLNDNRKDKTPCIPSPSNVRQPSPMPSSWPRPAPSRWPAARPCWRR